MIGKRGNLLAENIIFIVLNLVFLTILIVFVVSKSQSPAMMEEEMAKQIALLIDSAKPVTTIKINVEDALSKAENNNYNQDIIFRQKNIVTVKLRDKGGYSYSFFNDADVSIFPDTSESEIKNYVITINNYN
ncbi:hypothetical protein HY449_01465 [Candidatus Pacearchaeota archaeon]|nr:hypothetical protein [Candidatus Pacearchaeota archaeon]